MWSQRMHLLRRTVTLAELVNNHGNNNNTDVDFEGVFYKVYAHRGSGQSFLYVNDDGVIVLAIELWAGDDDYDALLLCGGGAAAAAGRHQAIGITDFTWQGHNRTLNIGQARTTARSGSVLASGTKKKSKRGLSLMQQRRSPTNCQTEY